MATPVISFQDYGFQYMAQAEPTLRHINLDIYPGEKVLIAGTSGSGKSTVGNCINGLIPFAYPGKSSGRLLVDGREAGESSIFELSHVVGTVLQDTDGQFIGLTVGEDIAFAAENDCMPQEEMKQLVDRVSGLVDIDHHLEYAPYELSGGQKQRVSLAGVMVEAVKVLLFDEPLANLDPAAGRTTIELIDMVHERTGAAVLIIEHRLEDVLWRRMDRIILMDEGAIVADLPTEKLLAGEQLLQHGIREPLYLTALRYAGVEITEALHPEHVEKLALTREDKEKVRGWYHTQKAGIRREQHGQELLRITDLKFGYTPEKVTLQDVNFTIHKGEMVSIVGRKEHAGQADLRLRAACFRQHTHGRTGSERRYHQGEGGAHRLRHAESESDDLQAHDLGRGGDGACAERNAEGGAYRKGGGDSAHMRPLSFP